MIKLLDRFTTQDGSWDVDITKPYGVDLLHLDKYRNQAAQLGGANHIYVHVPDGARTMFRTADGENQTTLAPVHEGWVNFPLYHSSAYNPDTGAVGPWEVWVNSTRIAEGIGLPYGWHVSTFLVVGEDGAMDGGPAPTEPPAQDKIQLIVNGKVVWSN